MSGERLLLDTTYIAGLLNRSDQHFARAVECLPRVKVAAEIVVTEAVLAEVGNLLSAPNLRASAADFIEALYEGPNVTVVSVDTPLVKRALEFYRRHDDKSWGLTDCISFVVMREHELELAVSADSDFHQAGFQAIMLLSN